MDRDKYCVIPTKYIELLTRAQRKEFLEVLEVVTEIRKVLGKEIDPGYYVCKHNEPYAESVRDMIEEGEEAKERILNVGIGVPSEETTQILEKVMGCQKVSDEVESVEDDSQYEKMSSNFIDTSKLFLDFDEFEIGVWESLENDATIKAKREEIQRHVERMDFLNKIGKENERE